MVMENQQRRQHMVAVPLPTQGHLNPLMRFCKLLVKHHAVTVTFVDFCPTPPQEEPSSPVAAGNPAERASPPDAAAAPALAASPPPTRLLRRVQIPLSALRPSNNFDVSFRDLFHSMTSVAPDLERLILSLNRHGPPVTCLLSDFGATFPTQDVADRLGIPRIVLYPCCATRLLLTHYLAQEDHISIQGVMEALATTRERGEVFCKGLPGLPTLLGKDIPHFKHIIDETLPLWEWRISSWKVCSTRAHAVVVNTFEGLEASTCTVLSKACDVPIYKVGFWVEPLSKESSTSLWKEDEACMTWLEQQPTSSVLYISFGSITLLSQTQFEALLEGLISSQQRFLWVLRPGLVKNMDCSSLVCNVISKSHDRGFVTGWAPQLQVLSHPSVGGFLTHCGWNSTSESIACGVPMLCWPYFADQPLNARCIVDQWKVGLEFEQQKEEGSFVEIRDEIEKSIRALMEGEEGRIVRANAQKLKKKGYESLLQNGSSYMQLEALIKSLE